MVNGEEGSGKRERRARVGPGSVRVRQGGPRAKSSVDGRRRVMPRGVAFLRGRWGGIGTGVEGRMVSM